ncbi:hypothetical protein GJ629_12400 [Halapricum sp. CBA1109]|uniref:type 1 glutamine amidotransferase n=1 Tax=Halapricum sp. CBA1109 TaxID=2668068 RepID=UPI0012FC8A95|nr:type 1 glutamine amidotransferase [Halapricum sp. CBA1109]MUV90600.1 hypothetical protein [Halapricum sp. CBA1109]
MSQPTVALFDAEHDSHNSRNFRRELDAEVVEFRIQCGERPTGYDFDAAVVTGSRSSVYWDEPWIDTLRAVVAETLDRGIPTLGVCFGHQVLADVLGGTVEPMGEYEIGYRTIERRAADPLLAGLGEAFTAFTTHSDAVTELPPGATLLAANDYGVHGFRKGPAYAVQFHPEYDTTSAREVTEGKDIDPERKRRVLDGIDPENYRAACETKRLFDNFLDVVAERSTAAESTVSAEEPARSATDD